MPRKSSIIDSKNTEEKLKKPRLSKKDKTVTISATEAVISDTIVTAISLAATTAVASPVTTSVTTSVTSPVTTSVTTSAANTDTIVKPKRGRKSKSELMALLNNTNTNTNMLQLHVDESTSASTSSSSNQIVSEVSDIKNEIIQSISVTKSVTKSVEAEVEEDIDLDAVVDDNKKVTKKRGRKPKGGKIIQNIVINETQKVDKPNVILHLKCSLKDLQSSSSCLIESYNFNSNELGYDIITKNDNVKAPKVIKDTTTTGASSLINDIKGFNIVANSNINTNINTNTPLVKDRDLDLSRNNYSKYSNYDNEDDDYDDDEDDDDYSDNNNNKNNKNRGTSKTIWRKLKQLEHNLHINNVNNKKSACFWCTCDFDNPPIYVPKHFINGTYHVYGCFCSPECGVAHLMNEPIDSSAKFERYHLLNHIYSKIYDYKKNIKPAPNPYYMLEKFYGNLSIQEYRALLRNERLFLIVDKPLTRILPELHEDNDEFILNNKIIASNNYQLKSRMQKKKPSKGLIMNEKFGLAA
jgi:hypothetical protein